MILINYFLNSQFTQLALAHTHTTSRPVIYISGFYGIYFLLLYNSNLIWFFRTLCGWTWCGLSARLSLALALPYSIHCAIVSRMVLFNARAT